jgi:PIN domain nuclease of toxin-antitoxin system
MDKTIQIQNQIRHNAEEISSALSEVSKWEKQIKNRDSNIKVAHQKAVRIPRAPIRSGVGTVPIQVNAATPSNSSASGCVLLG